MRRNVRNQRAESRTVQKSVQVLLVVSGVVFLTLGLALAVTGTSIDSAVGSVSDELGDADAPDDGSSPASDDADGAGNETSGDDESGDAGNDTDTGGDADGSDGDSSDGDGDTGDGDSDSSDDGGSSDGDTDGDDGTDSDGTQTLTTVVEDGDGNAVDGATVTVTSDDSSERRVVDGDGEAQFDLEDGEYTVTANADGYDAAESTVEIAGDDETVTLTLESTDDGSDGGSESDDGDDSSDGDDASDSDGTQTLTVVVEDGDGNAVDNATVTVTEEALFSSGSEREGTVDDDGEATFDLEDGRYEVTAEADGYGTDTDSVEIDGSDETITLTLQED